MDIWKLREKKKKKKKREKRERCHEAYHKKVIGESEKRKDKNGISLPTRNVKREYSDLRERNDAFRWEKAYGRETLELIIIF